jgi:serine/threonine protein kinase
LTGQLPYDTPSPSDLDRLRRGELTPPLRSRNSQVPQIIDNIVMRAMAPDVASRYQRAEDLLNDLLNARRELPRKTPPESPVVSSPGGTIAARQALSPRAPEARTPAISKTPRTRDLTATKFCWQCRKPLPARGTKCPFCGEKQ